MILHVASPFRAEFTLKGTYKAVVTCNLAKIFTKNSDMSVTWIDSTLSTFILILHFGRPKCFANCSIGILQQSWYYSKRLSKKISLICAHTNFSTSCKNTDFRSLHIFLVPPRIGYFFQYKYLKSTHLHFFNNKG